MRKIVVFICAALVPGAVHSQDAPVAPPAQDVLVDPADRLVELLPPEVASVVLDRIEAARARELPTVAMANLALEGVAKGRSGPEVVAAVERLGMDLGTARSILEEAGHLPVAGEVEAAAAAVRMGVDGGAVAELAAAGGGSRSMVVPLLVLAGLTERGLPADEALADVQGRLAAGVDDVDLLVDLPTHDRGRAPRPEQVGPALGGGFAGFRVPVAGITVPVGGPGGGPPDDLPGRGPHHRSAGG